MKKVTDPMLLEKLESKKVTDPELLQKLESKEWVGSVGHMGKRTSVSSNIASKEWQSDQDRTSKGKWLKEYLKGRDKLKEEEDLKQEYYQLTGQPYKEQDKIEHLIELFRTPSYIPEKQQAPKMFGGEYKRYDMPMALPKPASSLSETEQARQKWQQVLRGEMPVEEAESIRKMGILEDPISGGIIAGMPLRALINPASVKGARMFGTAIEESLSGLTMGGTDIAKGIGKKVLQKSIESGIDLGGGGLRELVEKNTTFSAKTKQELLESADFMDFLNRKPVKPKNMTDVLLYETKDNDVIEIVKQFQKDDEYIKQVKKFTIKDLREKMAVRIVDDTANIRRSIEKVSKDIGKKIRKGKILQEELQIFLEMQKSADNTVQKRVLMRGSLAEASRIMNDIDNTIFKDMTRSEIKDLSRIRESLRTIEISPRGLKTSGGMKHEKFINAFKNSNPEYYNKLMVKNKQIQSIYEDQLKQLLDNGLLNQKQFDNIISKGQYYNPRKVMEYIDPGTVTIRNGRKVTIGDSGLSYLKTGTEKVLEKDPRFLLQDYISRVQSRIAKNKANQALYDFALKNPDNEFVKIVKNTYKKTPKEDIVKVMIDGKPQKMVLPIGLAEEWKGIDPILSRQQANMIGWLSGSKVLKTFATGANPIFALRNFARDIGYVYMSPEYSGFIPKFTAQIINDYRETFRSALFKKGAYIDYIKQGGGMEFLSKQGAEKLKVLGELGDFSERWTRLAHRNRALVNRGLSSAEGDIGTFIARDALDFGQGGTWTKAADAAVPYLNAGIQGTRGFIKFAKKDPKKFAWKLANLAGASTGLYMWNTINYKDDYEKVSSRDKANNWIIMTPLTYKDKNDEIQRRYISIPKDQSQRIFTSLIDNAVSKMKDDKVDLEQIDLATKDFVSLLPAGESYLPPLMKASLGYSMNKDLWRNEDIWKGEDVRPGLESTKYTPEIYKKFGEATGISPERSKYAVEQYFTTNNTFTNYLGLGLDQIMKGMSPDEQALLSEDLIRNTPGIRAFLRGTQSDYKQMKINKEIKKDIASENLILKREQDKILNTIDKKDSSINRRGMINWIKKQPPLQQQYLTNRYEQYMELKNIDKFNWRWWMDVSYEHDPKAQAIMFHDKWKNQSSAKKIEMVKKLNRLDQTKRFNFTDRFWAEFQNLKKKE